jgi:hypothetical protein
VRQTGGGVREEEVLFAAGSHGRHGHHGQILDFDFLDFGFQRRTDRAILL